VSGRFCLDHNVDNMGSISYGGAKGEYADPIISERSVDEPRPLKVIYVGAGISGICAAIQFPKYVPNLELAIYDKVRSSILRGLAATSVLIKLRTRKLAAHGGRIGGSFPSPHSMKLRLMLWTDTLDVLVVCFDG